MLRFRKLQRAYKKQDDQEAIICSEVYQLIFEDVKRAYEQDHP